MCYSLKNTDVGVRNGCQHLNVFCGVSGDGSFLSSYMTIVEADYIWLQISVHQHHQILDQRNEENGLLSDEKRWGEQ